MTVQMVPVGFIIRSHRFHIMVPVGFISRSHGVRMVPADFITRSHELKIDFQNENFKNIFLSETTWSRALIFGIQHHLVDLYQIFSSYGPVAHPEGYMY